MGGGDTGTLRAGQSPGVKTSQMCQQGQGTCQAVPGSAFTWLGLPAPRGAEEHPEELPAHPTTRAESQGIQGLGWALLGHPLHVHLAAKMFDSCDNGQASVGFFIGPEGASI